MSDTLEKTDLTEDLLLVLDEMDDSDIPCSSGQAKLLWGHVLRWTDPCPVPAVWASKKPCGHQGHLCDNHKQMHQSNGQRVICRVCDAVCYAEDINYRRI